jgi:hypothetical protein
MVRSRSRLLGLAAALVTGGCFAGLGAEGLPCMQDGDCGLMLSCDQATRCCGGPCLDDGTQGGTTTTETTTTSTSETTSTTTDGSSTTETSGSTGPEIVCGDGVQDGAEECDLGDQENEDVFSSCTRDCTRPLFWFSPEQAMNIAMSQWDFQGQQVDETLYDTLSGDEGWVLKQSPRRLTSGLPSEPVVNMMGHSGVKRLRSSPFEVEMPPAGMVPMLHIRHRPSFDVCEPENTDGGRVHVMPAMDLETSFQAAPPPMPIAGDSNIEVLGENTSCVMINARNPWGPPDPAPVFAGESDDLLTHSFPIPMDAVAAAAAVGDMLVIELGAAFDCETCDAPDRGDRWVVEAVSVTYVPMR